MEDVEETTVVLNGEGDGPGAAEEAPVHEFSGGEERLLFFASVLIGHKVEVQVRCMGAVGARARRGWAVITLCPPVAFALPCAGDAALTPPGNGVTPLYAI